jgi:hypothetical protein
MTMTVDDETFFAWLDGELDGEAAAKVAAAVAADPRLAARAEQHRLFQARLRGPFDALTAAPVPERLAQAVHSASANVIPFSAGRSRRGTGWAALPQWAAIAATLVLGIGVGTTLATESGSGPVELRGGQMVAAAQLEESLDAQLASAAAPGGARVGLTFRDRSGAICRTFSDQFSSGMACRDGDDWRVRGLFAAPEGQSSDYRMAAGTNPNLAALIDSTMQGEPFDANQEKVARAHGWR